MGTAAGQAEGAGWLGRVQEKVGASGPRKEEAGHGWAWAWAVVASGWENSELTSQGDRRVRLDWLLKGWGVAFAAGRRESLEATAQGSFPTCGPQVYGVCETGELQRGLVGGVTPSGRSPDWGGGGLIGPGLLGVQRAGGRECGGGRWKHPGGCASQVQVDSWCQAQGRRTGGEQMGTGGPKQVGAQGLGGGALWPAILSSHFIRSPSVLLAGLDFSK